ncbi:hypothetical protein SEHO0A_02856 [Salmonella enterica subsp. houtenae str. ATCC BAA-1581]|nr:hypothetical protein SEHO0A_02856 [Salmonella enterica subsp. houtenae str. ATCC BAA-1581]
MAAAAARTNKKASSYELAFLAPGSYAGWRHCLTRPTQRLPNM